MTQIFQSIAEIPAGFGPSVVTIGNFDGVHCGHLAVLRQVISRAKQLGAKSVVVTFSPHPARLIRPESAPRLLTPDGVKLELLTRCGLDAVVVLPFTQELRMTTAHDFARRIVCQALRAVEVHEGDNFQFGYRGEGTATGLQQIGEALGFRTVVAGPLMSAGRPISSSRIRACLLQGRLAEARRLLGRSFSIRGTAAAGRGYGTRYTVPTINLAAYAEILPADGVYVTDITINQERFDSVTNIGNRPTFGADSFSVETHILDFHPVDLTETTPIDVTFQFRLRAERRFDSASALKEQIALDVARARRWFALRRVLSDHFVGSVATSNL